MSSSGRVHSTQEIVWYLTLNTELVTKYVKGRAILPYAPLCKPIDLNASTSDKELSSRGLSVEESRADSSLIWISTLRIQTSVLFYPAAKGRLESSNSCMNTTSKARTSDQAYLQRKRRSIVATNTLEALSTLKRHTITGYP